MTCCIFYSLCSTISWPGAVTSCSGCLLQEPFCIKKALQRLRSVCCVLPCSSNTNLLYLIHYQMTHNHKASPHPPSVDITVCHHPFPLPLSLYQHGAVRHSFESKQVIVIITINPFISLYTDTKAERMKTSQRFKSPGH